MLLAYQLLKNHEFGFRVTLIERRPEIGHGPAYHTSNSEHVLNVRATNMSTLPNDPGTHTAWTPPPNSNKRIATATLHSTRCADFRDLAMTRNMRKAAQAAP